MSIDDDDDRVGYGKPPKHSRFKPGRSGNPKGKKRATRSFSTEVRATLGMPVVLTDSDRPRKVTTSEAALMRLREKALKGDSRSLDRLIELRREYCDENDTASEQVDEEDAAILADYEARILQKHGYSKAETARNPISSKRKRK
jgi:GMP synthase PP-ATPase subunit